MLDVIRKGQRWLTAIFIAVIGLVFVFFIGLGGPMRGGPSAGDVVALDDIRFGQREFLRIRAQQEEAYRLQLGEQFDPRAAREMLDTMAVGSLVQRAILAHEAERLGLRVGKTEIQRILRDSPNFRDENGKFDNEAFSRYVEWEYGSQRNYLEHMRRLLLTQKMASLLLSQGQLSEAELRASVLYDLEQVRLAYVALETEALSPDVELTDQQIDDYLNSHEAEILALYEERQEDYHVPAQGKVRHILFAVDREAEESQVEAARERAEEALARLHANEEFEVLARELSDDPTSKDQGGDLGFVSPGELAGELEEVTVSLEPGVTSEIVRSDQGFHIVRVDERHESRTRTLDEVERELAREGAEMRAARDRANDLSAKLAQAIRDGRRSKRRPGTKRSSWSAPPCCDAAPTASCPDSAARRSCSQPHLPWPKARARRASFRWDPGWPWFSSSSGRSPSRSCSKAPSRPGGIDSRRPRATPRSGPGSSCAARSLSGTAACSSTPT